MQKKIAALTATLYLLTPCSTSPFIFDGLVNDLLIIEKMNEANRALITKNIKKLWNNTDTSDQQNPSNTSKLQTFDNLPGMPEDIREIVEFFTNGEKFAKLGARIPSGVLLYGPPGTGKTSAARIIAQQSGAAFFECSASSFIEIYIGSGPQHVRNLFDKAREHEKAIIFIDEIDAIGNRQSGDFENSERTNTLNELLNQMDGFKKNPGILVIAATNRLDALDRALLRPGRFDRLIKIDLPNAAIRTQILTCHCKNIRFAGTTHCLTDIAEQTNGFTGADLKNIVDEAAIFAARENAENVDDKHLIMALEKARIRPRK